MQPRGAEELREIARHHISRFEAAERASTDQLVKTSGWLTASLFALNGAGALGVLNTVEMLDSPARPMAAFLAGLLAALLSGVANQDVASRQSEPIESLIAYWRGVAIRGHANVAEQRERERALSRAVRFAFVGPLCGWLAAAAFVIGGIIALAEVHSHRDRLAALCRPIEQDALRARHRRPDSRDLITTLGCKPDTTLRFELAPLPNGGSR